MEVKRELTGRLLKSWMLIALALLILAVAFWDYELVVWNGFLREECLIAWMVGGVGATVCLAGAMYYMDEESWPAGASGEVAWYWRWVLRMKRRALSVMQLGTMGLALGAVALMVFGLEIPGPDVKWLDRGWHPTGAPTITAGYPRPSSTSEMP